MGEQEGSNITSIGKKNEQPTKPRYPEPDFTLKSSDEIAVKPKGGLRSLIDKITRGTKKGYDFMDGGITPKEVPIDEITDQKVAQAIKDFRLEVGRFGKYDPEFALKPFTVADILGQLGYRGNWETGKTNWREKYPEAYNATRQGIDELTRNKAIFMEPTQGNDPDNESVQYRIADENAILELSKPHPRSETPQE